MKKCAVLLNYPEERDFVRFELFEKILRTLEWNTITIRNNVWGNHQFRQKVLRKPYLLVFSIIRYLKYFFRLLNILIFKQYEFIYIAYPAYFDIIPTFVIAALRRKPVITEFFLSLYDTLVGDRKLLRQDTFLAKVVYIMDVYLIKLSSYVLVDTWENARRYDELFGSKNIEKFKRVIVGSELLMNNNLDKLHTTNGMRSLPKNKINIGWVGSYIPLHGIEKILGVIKHFKSDGRFNFILVGDGQEFDNAQQYIKENKLDNVTVFPRLDYIYSMRIMSQCNICLGIFGDSAKANAVIPAKIYDYIILSKKVITTDTPAMQELGGVEHPVLVNNDIPSICHAIEEQSFQMYNVDINGFLYISQLLEYDVTYLLNSILDNVDTPGRHLEPTKIQSI